MRIFLTSLILASFLLVAVVSADAQTATPSSKPTPKNFGQTVKQLRKDVNAKKKAIQQQKKAGTITKEQAKTQKKTLQQQFKANLKSLKPQPKKSPKPSPAATP